MSVEQTRPRAKFSVPTPGHAVKAKIVSAGLNCVDVAREAGISKKTLSDYFYGRLHRAETMFDIWLAFRRLSGSTICLIEFWGSLHASSPRKDR